MADLNGDDLRRSLRSADRFKERAIFPGSSQVKTPGSKSSALLSAVTRWDHFLFFVGATVSAQPDLRFSFPNQGLRLYRSRLKTISLDHAREINGPGVPNDTSGRNAPLESP